MPPLNQEERLRLIAGRVTGIPTLPSVMARVLEMIEDPQTNASQLARFIAFDQAYTVKILKLANSAFYGRSRKVGTVEQALVILGFDEVKNLGLTIAIVDTFKDSRYYKFLDMNIYWLHTIAVAAACKVTAEAKSLKTPGELFVAGLLHDIGSLVMCRDVAEDYPQVMDLMRRDSIPQHEAELQVLGFTHADVGGWLTRSWNLPVHQVGAITDHHSPHLSIMEPNLSLLVCFANELAWKAKYPSGLCDTPPAPKANAYKKLNLKRDDNGIVDWKYYYGLLAEEMSNAQEYLSVIRQDV